MFGFRMPVAGGSRGLGSEKRFDTRSPQNSAMAKVELVKGSYLSSFLQNTLKSNQVEINTDSRTLKPIAKLREPKDLFTLPKELDCPQQAARWPAECQVLDERIRHIDYLPIEPEVYYQPTGREIQPKPVGDDSGTIVFQYYPMSAVNYFSRSSVGGSRYFLPSCSTEREDDLRFESRFESGNLAKAVRITETYYELSLRTDLYTNRHMQWFYFRIENTRKNRIYRLSIVNLSKAESLYSVGMRPLIYSSKDAVLNKIGWRRCGENITYFRNDDKNGEDENGSFTLSFNLEFPHDCDIVYLAHCYPYTYTDLQDYLIKLQNHPIKSTFSKLRLLCRSLAGNNVYYLTITSPSSVDEPKRKQAVVITSRVHPGETPSSWMMKGFMDFLTGDSSQARELREKFIFKLIPMLNPDGVIVGNNRCSLTGRDLNRQYRTVIRETYPPVWHTKLMIRRLMEECGIAMYCDLHGHSRKHNIFIYGCENKRYADKRLQEQVFPLMLHKNAADKFSFENCKFRIQRSKEGTGRVVIWMMGVANSYTMEASFGGSTLGTRNQTHFTTQDYEAMGRAFCETLLDFCDENPAKLRSCSYCVQMMKYIDNRRITWAEKAAEEIEKKCRQAKSMARIRYELQERLRMKIITRLVKEGSNADEPTNIVLSDYSSTEGDTSSSDENDDDEERNFCSGMMVPPPSPISPHPQKNTQKDLSESPKFPRPNVISSPPPQRKILQVHRAILDLDQNSDAFEGIADIESGDEGASGKHASRQGQQNENQPKGFHKCCDKIEMPPELIVTQAQVYEVQSMDYIDKSPTKANRGRIEDSPSLPRKGDNSWSPERVKTHHLTKLQARYDISQDPAMKLNIQSSLMLRQTVWTGVEYCPECNPTPILMSTWGPTHSLHNDELYRSGSQKLGTLKKQYKQTEGKKNKDKEKDKDKSNKKEIQKPKIQKSLSEEIALTSAPMTPVPGKKRIRRKTTRSKKTTDNGESSATEEIKNDPHLHIEPIKVDEFRKHKDTAWKKPGKQPAARSRFRKGGIVATATVRTYADQDNETDGEEEKPDSNTGSKKKKKKRKLLSFHKRVRKAIATVTSKPNNDGKIAKQQR